jgi:hypothetical protein
LAIFLAFASTGEYMSIFSRMRARAQVNIEFVVFQSEVFLIATLIVGISAILCTED